MTTLLSLALTISLTGSSAAPLALATTSAAGGPIARAATEDAIRLAIAASSLDRGPTRQQLPPGWAKVRELDSGTEIVVTGAEATLRRWHVLTDDGGMTVLNLQHSVLTTEAQRELLALAAQGPERFIRSPLNVTGRHVRIGPDGVFVAGRRILDPGQVIEWIAREDVARIVRPPRRRGSKLGALIGAGTGVFLAGVTALSLATTPCGESCKDEKTWAATAAVGFPVGTGLLGYHGLARRSTEVIYRGR
jgi:hypothetical protein